MMELGGSLLLRRGFLPGFGQWLYEKVEALCGEGV